METDKSLKENWHIIKSKLKFRYPELTYSDLEFEYSDKDDLLTIIQMKTGKSRDDLMTEINTLLFEA